MVMVENTIKIIKWYTLNKWIFMVYKIYINKAVKYKNYLGAKDQKSK